MRFNTQIGSPMRVVRVPEPIQAPIVLPVTKVVEEKELVPVERDPGRSR